MALLALACGLYAGAPCVMDPPPVQAAAPCHDAGATQPDTDCCAPADCTLLTAVCAAHPGPAALGAAPVFLPPGPVPITVRQVRAPPSPWVAAHPPPHFPARPDVLLI